MALLTFAEPMPKSQLRVLAPAKLNVTLAVGPRRADGFHDLDSLVVGVDLCDRLSLASDEDGGAAVRIRGAAIDPASNLVTRAVEAFRSAVGDRAAGVRFDLAKRIPIGSGMGGGSSDAAAALYLLNERFGAPLSAEALRDVGATIGSDVPVFFALPAARMTGRGEMVEAVSLAWSGWALLVSAPVEVSTPAVYGRFDELHPRGDLRSTTGEALSCREAEALNGVAFNDLREAVFDVAPEIGELAVQLEGLGIGRFALTGAGSTFFRFYDDVAAARGDMQDVLSKVGDVTATVARCPVGLSTDNSEDN